MLTFPPLDLGWLVWVALVPLFIILLDARISHRQAVINVMLVGLLYYLVVLSHFLSIDWWGWASSADQAHHAQRTQEAFMRLIWPFMALWVSLFWGLFAIVVRWLRRGRPIAGALLVPSLWILIVEALAKPASFGFTWGSLSYTLHQQSLIWQCADVVGWHGLSWVIIFVNTLLASLLIRWNQVRGIYMSDSTMSSFWRDRTAQTLLVLLATVGVGCTGYGAWCFQKPMRWNSTPLRVALLQGNVTRYTFADFSTVGLDRVYGSMIVEALKTSPDVIILPETVWLISVQLDDTTVPGAQFVVPKDTLNRRLREFLAPNTLLIAGMDTILQGREHNSMLFWTTDGLLGSYHKRRLVPFSEYSPRWVGALSPSNRLHEASFQYQRGIEPRVVAYHGAQWGGIICQEVVFPETVRSTVRAGATLLVSTGNDGTFRSPAIAQEHEIAAMLRAVELRRYIVRVMKTGISSVIDPWGREVVRIPYQQRQLAFGEVEGVSTQTLYARLGDWVLGFAAMVVVLAMVPFF